MTSGPAAMPVEPTVRTRKNVPINSVAYFFIFCPPSEGAYYHEWFFQARMTGPYLELRGGRAPRRRDVRFSSVITTAYAAADSANSSSFLLVIWLPRGLVIRRCSTGSPQIESERDPRLVALVAADVMLYPGFEHDQLAGLGREADLGHEEVGPALGLGEGPMRAARGNRVREHELAAIRRGFDVVRGGKIASVVGVLVLLSARDKHVCPSSLDFQRERLDAHSLEEGSPGAQQYFLELAELGILDDRNLLVVVGGADRFGRRRRHVPLAALGIEVRENLRARRFADSGVDVDRHDRDREPQLYRHRGRSISTRNQRIVYNGRQAFCHAYFRLAFQSLLVQRAAHSGPPNNKLKTASA